MPSIHSFWVPDFDSFCQSQNGLFAPYNKPLNVLPRDGPFMIGQQSRSVTERRKYIDFVLEFQVYWEETPVFIL
jgi:hypothetical protein